jgi:hypothetical protein
MIGGTEYIHEEKTGPLGYRGQNGGIFRQKLPERRMMPAQFVAGTIAVSSDSRS